MKLRIKVEHNEIIPENRDKWEDWMAKVDGLGFFEIDLPKTAGEIRTIQQNRALHKYFQLVAENFNDHGFTLQKTLKQDVETWWNARLIKEVMWKFFQKLLLGKISTTELKRHEIDPIVEQMDAVQIARNLDPVPFPSNTQEL